jgi:hypothetical protein
MKLIPLQKLARKLPSAKGNRLHPSTLFRWSKHGVRATNGQIVRLQCVKMGGVWCSSWRWLKQFWAALNPGEQIDWLSPRQQRKQNEAIQAELIRRGYGDSPVPNKRKAEPQ